MVFLRRLGEYEMTEFLVRHFVKDYENTSKVSVRTAYGVLASVTGIFCNILLFAAKWLIGYLLSFGTQVEILSPASLRGLVAERAKKIYEKHKP